MMNEFQLIRAVIAGDTEKYENLVSRYHTGLIIHCERIVHDRDVAEDIAQEAFIKAYTHLERFNPQRSQFSTWLYRIATNTALDYLRQQKRQFTVEDIETLAEATMPAHIEDETRREVRQAVLELVPPEYRQVVESYYWEGKSYQQIADQLHQPVATIGTWLHRAKLQLREKLS